MTHLQSLASLRHAYATGDVEIDAVLRESHERAERSDRAIWIHRNSLDALTKERERVEQLDFKQSPMWGTPFAVKDNIDVAGCPTTAGCPEFSYTPNVSARVVELLTASGAVPIGKTNLDQFATGLTGARSPFGSVPNAVDSTYISGGSSSGSAVAVKHGIVPFALGTDTAGSGRIPAALNGVIGFKPTRGWWSTRGVVPACRTLDCVSVFTNSIADAYTIAEIVGIFDETEPYARKIEQRSFGHKPIRVGVLEPEQLPWSTDSSYAEPYQRSIDALPFPATPVDATPFLDAGKLLYEGPWLAERLAAIGDFVKANPQAIHPVTASVLNSGDSLTAEECFKAQYRLAKLSREVDAIFATVDIVVSPTAPTHFTQNEVQQDPIGTNSQLGVFTHCANLLDLCAIAVPSGTTSQGLPFGVSLLAPAGHDLALLRAASKLTGETLNSTNVESSDVLHIAVCGAHMQGQPLNNELTKRNATRVTTTHTAANYRFYALPDGKRPALIRNEEHGEAIELEVWSMPKRELGGFLTTVDRPLAIGSVELADGQWVHGFVGDSSATTAATDITKFRSWRRYRGQDIA